MENTMCHIHKIILLTALFLLFALCPANAGIRCGNDIISTGDTKVEVMVKVKTCGEILEKDGYVREKTYTSSENKETTTQTKVDQWYIRVKEKGSNYCYPLTFEDGELTTIGRWSRCK